LDAWWEASSERKRAPVHSDLALSAILFSDANLEVTAVQDLIDVEGIPEVRKNRLTELLEQAPIIFEVGSAFTTYPVWGEDGLSEYLRSYKVMGKALKERWGAVGVKDNQEYILNDYYDLEYRCVWADGLNEPFVSGAHSLQNMPCFSAVADGTDLFDTEIRKRQPFLYAKLKSELAKREDELLTVLFTSVNSRGTGPLAILDPDSVQKGVTVNYAGLLRYIVAKGTFADDKAFDGNLIQLRNMLDELGQRSTINSQTLGENISSGTPYSGYAMASQNGRIPIVPIQEACQKVIHDAGLFALKYFKDRGMTWNDLTAAEIPEHFKLKVTLEVDLPQDQVKTAQIASQLKDLVSVEWLHNLLQIHDSEGMLTDIMTEQATKQAFTQDLPTLVQQMLAMAMPTPPANPTPTAPPELPPGQGEVPPGYHQMPDGSMMPDSEMQASQEMPGGGGAYPSTPGGPEMAQAGGIVNPATQPMPPEQARRGRA
jgi:hypothetical protein